MPKVSICIPTYNRVHLLAFAIESALNQTYEDLEIIICDDGSQDDTPKLISQYTDKRIQYIRHPQNIGKSNNMRSGFEAATGNYFIKFDDDDRLTPDFIARTTAILDNNQNIDFVGTDHWIIDINNVRDKIKTQENSRRWGREDLPPGIVNNLLSVVFVNQSFQIGATLFRYQVLEQLGFMQPNWQNCEDNDLFVRLALAEKCGYYLPELLMEYRLHTEQQGINRAIPYLFDKLQYLENYQFEPENIEKIRLQRLAETKLLLGLRLIKKGDTQKGRELILAGKSVSTVKMCIGLVLSLFPLGIREKIFNILSNIALRASYK